MCGRTQANAICIMAPQNSTLLYENAEPTTELNHFSPIQRAICHTDNIETCSNSTITDNTTTDGSVYLRESISKCSRAHYEQVCNTQYLHFKIDSLWFEFSNLLCVCLWVCVCLPGNWKKSTVEENFSLNRHSVFVSAKTQEESVESSCYTHYKIADEFRSKIFA